MTHINTIEYKSIDEFHIVIPRCTQLCDSFNQIIDRPPDALLFSIGKTDVPQDYKAAAISGEEIPNVYENEQDSSRYFTTNQSKTHSFDGKSSSSSSWDISPRRRKSSPIELDIVENREHLVDNTDLSESLSIRSDGTQPESIEDKQITEDLEISPIMSISRQTTDNLIETNEFTSTQKQKKYYVKNLYSDVQADRLSINSSSVLLRKSTKRKRKSAVVVLRMRSTHQANFIQPPRISVHPAPTHTIRSFQRPFGQLKDPCQILEVYTQFKRINCKPYTCICMPLQPY